MKLIFIVGTIPDERRTCFLNIYLLFFHLSIKTYFCVIIFSWGKRDWKIQRNVYERSLSRDILTTSKESDAFSKRIGKAPKARNKSPQCALRIYFFEERGK